MTSTLITSPSAMRVVGRFTWQLLRKRPDLFAVTPPRIIAALSLKSYDREIIERWASLATPNGFINGVSFSGIDCLDNSQLTEMTKKAIVYRLDILDLINDERFARIKQLAVQGINRFLIEEVTGNLIKPLTINLEQFESKIAARVDALKGLGIEISSNSIFKGFGTPVRLFNCAELQKPRYQVPGRIGNYHRYEYERYLACWREVVEAVLVKGKRGEALAHNEDRIMNAYNQTRCSYWVIFAGKDIRALMREALLIGFDSDRVYKEQENNNGIRREFAFTEALLRGAGYGKSHSNQGSSSIRQ